MIDAVSMVGLDIAGVDVIANDIARPLADQNGGILEVNAGPAILMHLLPFSNPPRPVPESIVSFLFSKPEESRIPIVGVCGDSDQRCVTSRIAGLLRASHSVVGRATPAGLFVNERSLLLRRSDDLAGARMLLMHPKIEAAVIDVSLDRIDEEGLAFDRCQVAIVLGLGAALGAANPDTNDALRAALHVLLDSAQPSGAIVVNVDDPIVATVSLHSGADVIAISTNADNPQLDKARERGIRRVFLRHGVVILAVGSHEFPLFPRNQAERDRPQERGTPLEMLAVVAAGWALGLPLERLRREVSRLDIAPRASLGFPERSRRARDDCPV